jgi:hypothetical protein
MTRLEPTDPAVQAHEIAWTLDPVERCEEVDVLTLDPGELLEYVADLQEETRSLRRLVHAAVAHVAGQRDDLTRAARVTEHLRREFAALRQEREAA